MWIRDTSNNLVNLGHARRIVVDVGEAATAGKVFVLFSEAEGEDYAILGTGIREECEGLRAEIEGTLKESGHLIKTA